MICQLFYFSTGKMSIFVGSTVWRIFANEEVITELWKKKRIVCSLQQVHLEGAVYTDFTLHGLG